MYGWIWRRLPGRGAGKLLQAVVLAAIIVAVLWFVVFPWLGPRLPLDHVVVG